MFRTKLYYRIRPLLPWSVRVAVRRLFARRKRSLASDTWPVLPGSEKPPQNWPGWPEGKKFALVLTHDVESRSGVAKCRQLMELERQLGFRSCFSFVPQGEYTVSRIFRNELTRNGFEVGVHDLHHDGKLFHNRQDFTEKAARINGYLKDWGAVGFRSAFMLRNLEWLHDLDVQYDSSTFDTDPFEPQPDGVGTIFPFWVPRPNTGDAPLRGNGHSTLDTRHSEYGHSHSPLATRHSANGHGNGHSTLDHQRSTINNSGGYVELPYTLPQDSTLFLLFGERTPDIWYQKLDWVAKHGGMAMLPVHPDYMRFDGERPSARTFPADFYADFLEYARQRYGDSFWQPLPREVAAFATQLRSPSRPKPKRVCMLSYSSYLGDARVTRYAEALAERGDHVDVLALQRTQNRPARETIAGVNLICIQNRFGKTEKTKLSFLVPLVRFLFVSSYWIARQHTRKPYDVLHIHNVPDFLVFAAVWPRLTGAKVILDIHDIVPEFYASKFDVPEDSAPITLLKWIERAATRVAHRVIISNHLWLEKFAARTGANGKCAVFINNVDSHIFRPRPRTRDDERLIVLFPGGLQWHQGLDIALRAFRQITLALPQAEFHIYGDGNMKESLIALSRELGLEAKVRFFDPVSVRKVAEIMANADLGVVAKRADSFGNEAYSTKIMEFMSLGVPVVVSSTKIDRYYFDDSVVRFFESGNPDALARAMLEVLADKDLRQRLVARAYEYAAGNSWESRKGDYLQLVDSLFAGNGHAASLSPGEDVSEKALAPLHVGSNFPGNVHHPSGNGHKPAVYSPQHVEVAAAIK